MTTLTEPTATSTLLTARTRISWRDLVRLTRVEKLWELTLSLPWLIASLLCYAAGLWPLGLLASFFFFLTGLRQSHNAQHYALGIGKRAHDIMLFTLSLLMAASMHAVQVTHLHHHRHCLDDEDIEAGHANQRWWKVLLLGPLHPLRLHTAALRLGTLPQRRWIAAELLTFTALALALFLTPGLLWLKWHVAVMSLGECFTSFFAVWTVHHGCDEHTIARTQRGWLKNFLSYSMFFHLEHHLFPAIPTSHLPQLAARLDAIHPEARTRQVF